MEWACFRAQAVEPNSSPIQTWTKHKFYKISSLALKSNSGFIKIKPLSFFLGLKVGFAELLNILASSLTYKVPTKILARAFEPKLRLIPSLLRALFLAFGDRKSLISGVGFWKVVWALYWKAHLLPQVSLIRGPWSGLLVRATGWNPRSLGLFPVWENNLAAL